jgi:hypothetical protein
MATSARPAPPKAARQRTNQSPAGISSTTCGPTCRVHSWSCPPRGPTRRGYPPRDQSPATGRIRSCPPDCPTHRLPTCRVSPAHTAAFATAPGFGGKCLPKDLAAIIHAAADTTPPSSPRSCSATRTSAALTPPPRRCALLASRDSRRLRMTAKAARRQARGPTLLRRSVTAISPTRPILPARG